MSFIYAAVVAGAMVYPGTGVIGYDRIRKTDISIIHLETIISEKQVSIDEFSYLMSGRMREYSKNTGFEACANICKNENGGFGAVITTVESQVSCPITNACPKNYKIIGVDIHSHPPALSVTPNKIDKMYLDRKKSFGMSYSLRPDSISNSDKGADNGYIVMPDKLINHKSGRAYRVVESKYFLDVKIVENKDYMKNSEIEAGSK